MLESLTCNMCGGTIVLSPDQTSGVCEYCGSTVSMPKFNRHQRVASMNRGNEFRACGDFDTALSIYEHIIAEDDTDAEAHWCCSLCRFGIEYVQDPTTLEFLPTCHRLSLDSFLEDVDYQAAMAHSMGMAHWQYQREGAKIAAVLRSTLSTSQEEAPYDIFLCCKEKDENELRTEDSLLAQDIFYHLTDLGYRVFFARISLMEKTGEAFEPYIFSALRSARVMIVIGTNPEHLNAPWVKNEWSRFLNLKKRHPKKLLLPCYKDMDPQSMPAPLNSLQSYDMSQISFLQDLLYGVKKLFPEPEAAAPAAAASQPQPVSVVVGEGGITTENLLTRAKYFLEDKNWAQADHYCERALDTSPQCGDAYFYKIVAAFYQDPEQMVPLGRRLVSFSPDFTKTELDSITQENALFFWELYQRADIERRLFSLLELYPFLALNQLQIGICPDCSLLNDSIQRNNVSAVKLLLDRGADPNSAYRQWLFGQEPCTCSPLSDTMQSREGAQMVRLLLERGADPALTDPIPTQQNSTTPMNIFQQSVFYRRPDILSVLLEWQDQQYARTEEDPPKQPRLFLLRQAVSLGFDEMARVLLEHQVDPNQAVREDESGSHTLLSDALELENSAAMADLLLEHGADPNGCDVVPSRHGTQSIPVLHRAVLLQKPELISLLLEHGASWDTSFSNGKIKVPLRLYPYHMDQKLPADFLSKLSELGWKRSVRSAFALSGMFKKKVHQLVDFINE